MSDEKRPTSAVELLAQVVLVALIGAGVFFVLRHLFG